jgi:hypothetical protein
MAWKYTHYTGKNYSKYSNTKITREGRTFDSKREARRYTQLRLMEDAGEITDLQCQVRFVLIPAQREFTNEIYTKGKKKGCFKPGKLIERECAYIADFVYIDAKTGERVVEDTKGMKTEAYIIKRKLMLERYGIQIREI